MAGALDLAQTKVKQNKTPTITQLPPTNQACRKSFIDLERERERERERKRVRGGGRERDWGEGETERQREREIETEIEIESDRKGSNGNVASKARSSHELCSCRAGLPCLPWR